MVLRNEEGRVWTSRQERLACKEGGLRKTLSFSDVLSLKRNCDEKVCSKQRRYTVPKLKTIKCLDEKYYTLL